MKSCKGLKGTFWEKNIGTGRSLVDKFASSWIKTCKRCVLGPWEVIPCQKWKGSKDTVWELFCEEIGNWWEFCIYRLLLLGLKLAKGVLLDLERWFGVTPIIRWHKSFYPTLQIIMCMQITISVWRIRINKTLFIHCNPINLRSKLNEKKMQMYLNQRYMKICV